MTEKDIHKLIEDMGFRIETCVEIGNAICELFDKNNLSEVEVEFVLSTVKTAYTHASIKEEEK